MELQGLRTLVLCERTLTEAEWREWNMRFAAASSQLVDREAKVCVLLVLTCQD